MTNQTEPPIDYKALFDNGWKQITTLPDDPVLCGMIKMLAFEWFENGVNTAHRYTHQEVEALVKESEARISGDYTEQEAYGRGLDQGFQVAIDLIRKRLGAGV
jgi:hypothetical protein